MVSPRVAFVLGLLQAVSTVAHAATIRIPADYPTIQQGVDFSGPGDTILVSPGVYSGPGNRAIDFRGADRDVRAEGGPEVTVIDCEWTAASICTQERRVTASSKESQ